MRRPRWGRWIGVAALALAAVCAPGPGAAQEATGLVAPGEVRGRVLRSDGEGLAHAWIRYRTDEGRWSITQTGAAGDYRLRVPPGRLHLEGSRIGYRPAAVEVVVPPAAVVRVDLHLEARPIAVDGLVVRADRFAIATPPPPALRATAPPPDPELDLITLTLDAGVAEVAATVLAASGRPGEPAGGGTPLLLMRGSPADLKLLLLDGAPVHTPFHLAGLLDGFAPDLLGRTSHFVGAAPARLDGGIDYILDVATRAPRDDGRLHLQGHADLLSAGAGVEWGRPEAGILASGRSLHGGGLRPLMSGAIPYGYADGLVRGVGRIGNLEVHVTGFANEESVELEVPDAPTAPGGAGWSNRLLSLRAYHRAGAVDWQATGAVSRYTAALPLRGDAPPEPGTDPILARGATRRVRAAVEGAVEVGQDGGGVLRFGVVADHTATASGSIRPTGEGDVQRTELRGTGLVTGGHLEWSTRLAPTVAGRVGYRLDRYDPGGVQGALRGSLSWALTSDATLTFAGGRYRQFTRTIELPVHPEARPLPTLPTGPSHQLLVSRGDHLLVGLDQQLTEALRLGLQAHVKQFGNLGPTDPNRRASGVDLRIVGTEQERTGWLGYSLSWSWTGEDRDGITPRFQGRHLLTAGFRGPLFGGVGLDARVSFSDGLPLTEVPIEAGAEARDVMLFYGHAPEAFLFSGGAGTPPAVDGFLRLDLELHREWDAPGGAGRIRPYLKVMNALDQRDAFFYYFEPWRSADVTPLARRSIVPVVGFAWRF